MSITAIVVAGQDEDTSATQYNNPTAPVTICAGTTSGKLPIGLRCPVFIATGLAAPMPLLVNGVHVHIDADNNPVTLPPAISFVVTRPDVTGLSGAEDVTIFADDGTAPA